MCVCSVCGKENRADARFCHWCGVTMLVGTLTGRLPTRTLLHNGRYLITHLLGQGGMGAVYKALDLHNQKRVVAVKEMSQSGLSEQERKDAVVAFIHEATLLARLSHRSLPRIYQQFAENGRYYLVMEFIEGVTLLQYWENHIDQGRLLPLKRILDIGIQLCVVLDYLHQQQPPIIFRDLKPANIMLTPQEQVYLIDFGIARLFKPGQTKDTVALGSPGYAPPEQYRSATSPRSDIYSLGAVLHQLLTEDEPSQTPFHFAPFSINVPRLEALVTDMVQIDEMQRPASMKSVQQVLQQVVQELAQNTTGIAGRPVTQSAGMANKQVAPKVTDIRSVDIFLLASAGRQDQQLKKSIQDQLAPLIDAIPDVRICSSDALSVQSIGAQHTRSNCTDLILLLLSDDFLTSPICINDVKRACERAKTRNARMQALLLRPCAWQKTSLAHVPQLLPHPVTHLSSYAQEQRILEAANGIYKQLIDLILVGRQAGPMNMLQWLLWQLHCDGGLHCPYFVLEQYTLKYVRPSGYAGALFQLIDRGMGQTTADYVIGAPNSVRMTALLRAIAPSASLPQEVQGIAARAYPLQLEVS